MNQIDTSIYGRMRTPAQELSRLGQSLGGYADNYRQGQMNNLQLQQQDINLQNQQRKQEKEADYQRRQGEYQKLLALDPMMTPEVKADLENRMFAPEILEQKLRSRLSGGSTGSQKVWKPIKDKPGWKINMVTGEEVFNKELFGSIGEEAQSKIDARTNRNQREIEKIELAWTNQDWKEASKLVDQKLDRDRLEFDQKKKRELMTEKLSLGNALYEQKQGQQLNQVPFVVREKWRGGSKVEGGKDLIAADIKYLNSATEGVGSLLSNTDKLLDLVEKYGLEKMPGKEREQMKTLIGQIQLQYKGEEFANLGVLTGPDLSIIQSVTGDPTDFMALDAGVQASKMRQFREGLLGGYNFALNSKGFDSVSDAELLGATGHATPTTLSSDEQNVVNDILKELED